MFPAKKVSFILAIYNAERTLQECLDSIINQSYAKKDYEIIIVDGGSTDNTLSIIKTFMHRYHKQVSIRLLHNPHKLSEGKGMGKDQGVAVSRGAYICFLDHDNILTGKKWIETMLFPLETNHNVAASQSFLTFKQDDPAFLKYVNAVGVEDAFAIPYSLVAQVVLHPERFKEHEGAYYFYLPHPERVLYGGANGCIFRKEVFKKIGSYTRDVNVSASMAEQGLAFAVVKDAFVHHKTGSDFFTFLKKKALYFHRFVSFGYKDENFRWVGKRLSDKLRFYTMVIGNLILLPHVIEGCILAYKKKQYFWLLHPFYVWTMTVLYICISLAKIKQYTEYVHDKQ
jgi:glycosyltransferase involved in cell wall biosynthesis